MCPYCHCNLPDQQGKQDNIVSKIVSRVRLKTNILFRVANGIFHKFVVSKPFQSVQKDGSNLFLKNYFKLLTFNHVLYVCYLNIFIKPYNLKDFGLIKQKYFRKSYLYF